MKLRQKLAMVLAAAMVVTAVPVTTMAKSKNEMNKVVSVVEGTPLTQNHGVFLEIEIDNNEKETVFFLGTEAFEFDKDAYTAVSKTTDTAFGGKGVKVEILSKTEARVTVPAGVTTVKVPVLGKVLKGNPAIIVDGQDSVVTSGKYSLTNLEVAGDKALVATAGDAKNISVDGEGTIADITIEEKVAGTFAKGNVQFELKLPNRSDLDFDKDAEITVEGKRGHANKKLKATPKYKDGDKKVLLVTVTGDFSETERGSIVLKNIGVQPENRREECKIGEVKVTLKGSNVADTDLVVANVADYAVGITVVDDKKAELVGGKEAKKVKVKVKETAIGSLDDRKDIYFTVEGAHVTTDASIKLNDGKAEKVTVKDGEIHMDLSKINDKQINELEMELELYADASQSGAIKLVAESKNFEEEIVTEIGTVAAPFTVKSEALNVKVGVQGQVGGQITLTETDKGMFEKGEKFFIESAETKYFSMDDAKVEVTEGDLEIESKVNKDGIIEVTVKRPSSEASTIKVSNVEVTTNRTIPEGKFDVEIYGAAISDMNDKNNPAYDKEDKDKTDVITVKDFFVVGSTEAAAKEIKLTVGSTTYTVNGETKTADAAAFIDANNRTMVPVRFVASEFGKVDFGTINGVGTVTVFNNGSVLQFQNGSNIMNKNGINIPMDTKVVIKDGRTYVPFKYVADGLGIGYSYDAATKTITFK